MLMVLPYMYPALWALTLALCLAFHKDKMSAEDWVMYMAAAAVWPIFLPVILYNIIRSARA